MALNLAAILILKQFGLNIKEWILPLIKIKWQLRTLDAKWDVIEKEGNKRRDE